MTSPDLLALDFDGVLCDGLPEYFASSWRTGQQVWGWQTPAVELELAFRRLRPVVLHGWEMPLLLWALQAGYAEVDLAQRWAELTGQLLSASKTAAADLQRALDQTRLQWMAVDQADWLSYQRLYPGVEEQVRRWLSQGQPCVIITTKGTQFVQDLLASRQLDVDPALIFGKEVQQSKAGVLRQLLDQYPQIWFVEDRLPTLEAIAQQPELEAVRLFLADWGYNTPDDRERLGGSIQGLRLDQFCSGFEAWLSQ
jgi:phosphoglycolate phosphatase-like HAD superfamily hydrolase